MKLAVAQQWDSNQTFRAWMSVHALILLAICPGLPLLAAWAAGSFSSPQYAATAAQVITCFANGRAHFQMPPSQFQDSYAKPRQAWVPSLFLSITLGFGNFTFSTAKGMDVVWDLVIGRGGQLVLATLTYPVVRRALSFCMEERPVSLELYSAIAFEHGFSLSTLRALCLSRGCTDRRKPAPGVRTGKRRPFVYIALFFLGTYLLAFPTLVSTMTGYQVTMKAYALEPNGGSNLVDVSALTAPTIVVVDGQRIGLGDFYTATFDEELAWEAYDGRGSSSVGPENVTSVGLWNFGEGSSR
ncbi:hypothetical protein LTR27_010362 [Elasticomyces elasticus]|nr:hypothetical protein LTR27_010362 [Elasticomyces elasticus]